MEIASKAIDSIEPEFREFINRTLSLNKRDLPEAKRRIREFMETFSRELDREEGEEIFQINTQFFQLSNTIPKERR